DYMYLNMGASKGVQVGDMFAVVRPKGQVDTKWTSKGRLGFYVQEVGAVQIVRVKQDVSVARIKASCDVFMLGDLVQPIEQRSTEMFAQRPPMDLFADPSGKAKGHIFMARDNQELVSRDQVVYVDLGHDDSVQVGDRLTIFRQLGKGNISRMPNPPESISARSYGYESLEYRGGKFSNQAARKSGDTAEGRVVTTKKAKEGRPEIRKIVGEGMILNVKEKTATVLITRTAQEIQTGDSVEVQ
ncbi:MAG: FlgT C-terminal domain-containing protein, partial [Pyrinomonadaceae bacterium]